jgi:hypothetical protein
MEKSREEGSTILVRNLPDDLRQSEAVQAFLREPLPAVAAMITAALSMGREQMVLAGGRVAQAILKGRAMKQLGKELEELHQKGKLREDYADSKYGFHSLVELLTLIEEETPDEDKLRTAKALFLALNSPQVQEGEALVRYQVFRLVLKLSGSQLLLLGVSHRLFKENFFGADAQPSTQYWLNQIATRMGHNVLSLVAQDEAVLMQHLLLTPRLWTDGSGVNLHNARLTELGVRMSELIETYSGEIPAPDASVKSATTKS